MVIENHQRNIRKLDLSKRRRGKCQYKSEEQKVAIKLLYEPKVLETFQRIFLFAI